MNQTGPQQECRGEDGASVFEQVGGQALGWGWAKSEKVSGLLLKELWSQKGNDSAAEEIEALIKFQELAN